MRMSFTTLSRAALLPLSLSLNLNPLLSIAARTSSATPHHQLQSPNLKPLSGFHPQCPSFLHSYSTSSTMSSDSTAASKDNPTNTNTNTNNQQPDNPTPKDQQQPQQHEPQLALPDSTSSSSSGAPHKLDLSGGGSTAKLDHLGPMVVNTDGTLSQISNWEKMTEGEKKATLRVLGKRNKQRLEALKEARAAKGEDQS